MGIGDRDYMRERYRQRQGIGAGTTWWNEGKARRELRDGNDKAVPLGSASWVGGEWFDAVNRGQDYQKTRYRPRRSRSRSRNSNPLRRFFVDVFLRICLAVAAPYVLYRVYVATMIPALQALVPIPFPAHGSVYVTPATDLEKRQGLMRFKAPEGMATSYVVMLHDIEQGHDVLGIFVASGRKTKTPVPIGTYRVRIAEGNPGAWRGPERLFGTTIGRELISPLSIVQATDKTLDLATPLTRVFKIDQNTNRGFVEP